MEKAARTIPGKEQVDGLPVALNDRAGVAHANRSVSTLLVDKGCFQEK